MTRCPPFYSYGVSRSAGVCSSDRRNNRRLFRFCLEHSSRRLPFLPGKLQRNHTVQSTAAAIGWYCWRCGKLRTKCIQQSCIPLPRNKLRTPLREALLLKYGVSRHPNTTSTYCGARCACVATTEPATSAFRSAINGSTILCRSIPSTTTPRYHD